MVKQPKVLQSMLPSPNGNKPSQIFIKTWEGKINPKSTNKGISVIEILVVIAILLIAFVGILGLLTFSLQTLSLIKETTFANFLAQETIESVRNFRDGTDWATNGLGTLTVGVSYHPEKTADIPAKWILAEGEETIGNFTRKIILENVQRDGNDNIVEEGGTNDPDTNKIKITVSWKDKKVEIITYLTNWK